MGPGDARDPWSDAAPRPRPPLGRRWLVAALVGAAFILLAGAGAAVALESDTVDSYWRGLWWATSLMTTAGFVGRPPTSAAGAGLSAVLMVAGFLLISLVSASLASVFIRDSEREFESEERVVDTYVVARLAELVERLDRIESASAPPEGTKAGGQPGESRERGSLGTPPAGPATDGGPRRSETLRSGVNPAPGPEEPAQ